MKRFLAPLVFAALTGISGTVALAQSAEAPVVVELFTSQGCSSCPPADAYLGTLTDREDVIALSLHVDYWDYLGWRDLFGSPAHTQRQRNYAAVMRERMVYTPQIVVQGAKHVVGSHKEEVEDAIAASAEIPAAATVSLRLKDDLLIAEISPKQTTQRQRGRVLMAWYTDAERVKIQRGENRGSDFTYHNVVKGWSELGTWDGARQTVTAPKPMAADGVAILIQSNDGGPIMAAAKMALD
ncbi:MAG: DUF1223 domain-containing protein [Pseudomonadota bacterium]